MSEAYSVSRVGRNGHTPDGPSIDPSRARSLLFDQVTANPFRTLGVPADAARSDLHASAASLRRAFKLGTTSRTDWDLDWLSPLVRAEGTLQMALGRIGTIDQRLVGRAFWFGSEALANLKAYEVRKQPVSTWPAGRTNEHDSALFALLHRIESDANVEDVSGWTKRLKAWVVALGDGAYWNWVLDADRAGGFMPLAAESDLATARQSVLRDTVQVFTTSAKTALIEGNDALVVRILEILRSSISDEAMLAVVESDVLGQMEEEVARLCADLQGDCNKKVVREKDKRDVNIPVSTQITARVNKELIPLVAKAEKLAGKDSRMAKRCRAEAADVLDSVGSAWTWAYDFAQSASLLEQANAMSAGTTAEGRYVEQGRKLKVLSIASKLSDCCKILLDDCKNKVSKQDNKGSANRPICSELTRRLDSDVMPLFAKLKDVASPTDEAFNDCCGEVAILMSAIGSSWTWADDLEQAASMMERANRMSAGTFVAGKFAEQAKKLRTSADAARTRPAVTSARTESGSSFGKWVVWGLIAVAVYVFFFNSPFSRRPDPPYIPPAQIETTPSQQSIPAPSPDSQPVVPQLPTILDLQPAPELVVPAPTFDLEFEPPVGTNNVLNQEQLRYCLSQHIRLEGARSRVVWKSRKSVAQFNGYKDFFQARCSKYRYYEFDLQMVQPGIDGRRAQLLEEGAGWMN